MALPPPDQKPVATGSRSDGLSGAKPKPKKRARVVQPPAGDIASSGGDYGTQRAKRGAKTARVKRNTAAVYKAQPVAQRQEIVKHATGPTGRVVQDVHEQRRQRAEDLAHAQAAHDILGNTDLATAAQSIKVIDGRVFSKKDGEWVTVDKVRTGLLKNVGLGHTKLAERGMTVGEARQLTAEGRAGGPIGKLTGVNPRKVLDAAPADALELAVTTPSSVAKLASTAVTHPTRVPGMLAAPYIELYKHPKQFIESHPVSAALMLNPVARAPGRLAGRAARLTGKQTLARPTATLPGTALREARAGSKDVTIRAMQARRDAKRGAPVMTAKQVQRQVDETYAQGKTHAGRVEAAAYRQARKQAKTLPRAQRKAAIQTHVEGARGGARNQAEQQFARQFGATAYHQRPALSQAQREARIAELESLDKSIAGNAAGQRSSGRFAFGLGNEVNLERMRADIAAELQVLRAGGGENLAAKAVLVKPKNATEGVLHDTRPAAQAVADALNKKQPTVKAGTRLYGREDVPNEFVVRGAGDKFAVLPKIAADRMTKQQTVGTSKATVAKVLRQSRSLFTRTVLPYRPTWLSGQAIEGVVRSAAAGAGPTSYLRAKKVVRAMEAQKPGSGKALLERAAPGGLVGRTAGLEMTSKTMREEFPDSTVARALTDVGRTPGVKQVRQLHHAVSSFVFEKLNAKTLEGIPQTVMLGKALKSSPLMERSFLGLSDKAIQDAARGLQGTEHQVAAARAVERMYGKYAGFSPKTRELLMHWTPFLPWYINTAQFLLSVLPKDEPVAAALAASAGVATEEWRKAQGLSLRGGETLPAFMLGGYPTHGGKTIERLGHYTPFGVGTDVTGAAAALPLPQFKGAYDAISSGLDWKGHQLKHPDGTPFNQGERWLYGLTQLAESFVPLASQTEQVVKAKNKPAAIRKQLRVISSTPANRPVSKGPAGVPPPPAAGGGPSGLPAAPPPPHP